MLDIVFSTVLAAFIVTVTAETSGSSPQPVEEGRISEYAA